MLLCRLQAGFWIAALGIAGAQPGAFTEPPEHPAIDYYARPVHDPIASLNAAIRGGRTQLTFAWPDGYLRAVLSALGVPVESQMAVFSKTSLQAPIIGPSHPRTVFFNDSVVVAWVPGEPFVEAASQDPQQGVLFYKLVQWPASQPQFVRDNDCLTCHVSYASLNVPGMLLRSVYPDSKGVPLRTLGDYEPNHGSPFAELWGGWYVTGDPGTTAHMGNTVYLDARDPARNIRVDPKWDGAAYLTPFSDVVALMVFDHQMRLMNLLTRFGWQIRVAAHEKSAFDVEPPAKEIAGYLLFVDEAPFAGRMRGTSGFAEAFARSGIRDHQGRSLRDLDLEHRLMRYPCSYMIYAPAFDGLPEAGKDAIYRQLWQVLSGRNRSGAYAKLSASDRKAVVEILRETKTGLPDYFRSGRLANAR